MRREITTRAAVAQNLRALMRRHDNMTQTQLAEQSGVSQRHISSILNELAECGIEKAEKLARVFGLKGWMLQVPGMPEEVLDSKVLGSIVQSIREASPEGRDLIEKTARREAFFSKKPESS
jgi:transcriptional regulator with XRE-family HTH domain